MTQDQLFLTEQEATSLAAQLNRKNVYNLEGKLFTVSGKVVDPLVEVKVVLKNADESFYYPVEARMEFGKEDKTAREAALFLIDYIDVYFEEYFEQDGELLLPINWTAHEYDAVNFELKGQVLNMKLERWADQLIGQADLDPGT